MNQLQTRNEGLYYVHGRKTKRYCKKINETGRILVSEIQELYQISADCARRDLRILESKGLLQRTHGGAISVTPKGIYPSPTYNPIDIKETQADYLAVAKRAVEYIESEDVIYITTSLVGHYMAENLPENIPVTVLTNSITIAEALRKKMNISVILLGREMSHRGHCHDFYTIQMVKNIRIDKAFLSHTALSLDFGASIHNSTGVEFGKAIMESSSINIGLYPSKKIGKNSIHSVCKINEYDFLITDNNVSEDFLIQAKELGVVIETVEVNGS